MRNKLMILLTMLVVGTMVLAACGGGQPEPTAAPAAPAEATTEAAAAATTEAAAEATTEAAAEATTEAAAEATTEAATEAPAAATTEAAAAAPAAGGPSTDDLGRRQTGARPGEDCQGLHRPVWRECGGRSEGFWRPAQ